MHVCFSVISENKILTIMNELVNQENAATFRWGSKRVKLSNQELELFFEELANLDIYDIKDLDFEIQEIADFTLLGAPDNLEIGIIKKKIKLLRLIYNTMYAAVQVQE